jgi:predicted nucleotidyltransferase
MSMDLQNTIDKILPILHKSGVTRAALFGSSVLGDTHGESDLDILVEFTPDKSLLDLADLKLKLEEALGRPVDVLTFESVHPRLRPYIERDQVPIAL